MEEFSAEKHRQKLEELSKRGLSNEQIQMEIRHIFNEDNWLFELKEFLQRQVNSRISYKLKGRYDNERMYFSLRSKVEDDIIADTNWYSYFENIDLNELQTLYGDCKPLQPATLMLVVSKACRDYIDNGEEAADKAKALHDLYLKLKETLSSDIPFPIGDAFADYLKSKTHRIDLENCRISGDICPFCESTDVKSYGANWKCRSCGREFRKRKAQKTNS